MKKTLIVAVLLGAAIVTIGAGCGKSSTTKNTNVTTNTTTKNNTTSEKSVTISNFTFSPATLAVAAGTTVTWTNEDTAAHTVVSETFSSGNLAKGQAYSFTFSTPGTYDYNCGLHPTMTGTVIVQ